MNLRVLRIEREHLRVVRDRSIGIVLGRMDSGAHSEVGAILRLGLDRIFDLLERMSEITLEVKGFRALGGRRSWPSCLT